MEERKGGINIEICAFCGRNIAQVNKMIKSPYDDDTFICSTCAKIAYTVSHHCNDETNKKSSLEIRRNWEHAKRMKILQKESDWNAANFNLTPNEIHKELNKYIIGQEKAKKVLSVALYNHYKRLNDKSGLLKKSNILLIGPSGSGKTLLAKCIATLLDVPFVSVDATAMTEAGYVGSNVESCIENLLYVSDWNLELAQRGVVFIDEIDKISRSGGKRSSTRDVSGEGVQAGLLKILENSQLQISTNSRTKKTSEETILFDTTNVLFICGGAFEGLFDNPSQNKPIGFHQTENSISNSKPPDVSPDALIKYGLMPEFMGRFPILCSLETLTTDDLVRILTEPEDAIIKEYQLLFKQDGINLEYEDNALKEIAKMAIEMKTGARGLRSILEDIMLDVMYELPNQKDSISKCIITKKCVESGLPTIIKKRQRKKQTKTVVSS